MSVNAGLIRGIQRGWLSSVVVGTVVGVTIFAGVIAWAGLGNVWNNFGSLNYGALGVYIALTVCTYFFRAWRFRMLVHRGTVAKFYGVVSIHTLMINLLPFSSGEISYPVLLKRYGVSADFLQSIPSLLIARVQDIFINLSLVVIGLIWAGNVNLALERPNGKLTLFFGLAVVSIGLMVWLAYKRWGTTPQVKRIAGLVSNAVTSVRETTLRTWAMTFLLTLTIRIISVVGVLYLFYSVGVSIPLAAVFLITGLYVFLPLLPVNTPGGIGITEAFLVGFFLLCGLDRGTATAASVQIHSLQLGVAAILGAIGLIQLQYLKRRTTLSENSEYSSYRTKLKRPNGERTGM